ncbi:MAG: PaaX family transcriptional regulator C-terminal domain-containing protein [Acidimicrobiales bacterium]
MSPTPRRTTANIAPAAGRLPAQRGGAKALVLTMLGEYVLPAGGEVWTATLVTAADALGIGEKNARQAVARIGDLGLIAGTRHGRAVRWSLTPDGRRLLESGARRIYGFGRNQADWDGRWLLAHCPVAESQRSVRTQLRKRLGFLGFGELAASLLVSPHVSREGELRIVLEELGIADESTVLLSTTGSNERDIDLVRRAWSLDEIEAGYRTFIDDRADEQPSDGPDHFRALIELVHDWRRFPFTDPELPAAPPAADVGRRGRNNRLSRPAHGVVTNRASLVC